MAYNAMLSLFPATLAFLTAIGLFKPLQTTFLNLWAHLSEVAPQEVIFLIQDFAEDISTGRNGGLFSLSFAIAIWASSGALSAAMTALDQIHQVPRRLRRPFWKARMIAVALTMGTILLLILASGLVFVSNWAVDRVAQQSGNLEGQVLSIWSLLTWPVALGIISIAFAFIYRFGPSRWIEGKPLLPGAMLAAIFWIILSNLFRYYVAHFGNYNKAYGAVGAVIVLMLWLYLTSLVLLLGDQLNVIVGKTMQRHQLHRPTEPRKRRSLPQRLLPNRPLHHTNHSRANSRKQ